MNCNIFWVQLANNFHIFPHIRCGLAGKAGDKVHIDDGKGHLSASLVHAIYIFRRMPPPDGVEKALLHRLGIDADTGYAAAAQQVQYVFRRRIGPPRFDSPFFRAGKDGAHSRHQPPQYRQRQARRRAAAYVSRADAQAVLPAQTAHIFYIGDDGVGKILKCAIVLFSDKTRRKGTVHAMAGTVGNADIYGNILLAARHIGPLHRRHLDEKLRRVFRHLIPAAQMTPGFFRIHPFIKQAMD